MKRRKWTKEERKQIYNKYKGRCAYCGIRIKPNEMQVDHIKALRCGGANSIENANPSCRMCNELPRRKRRGILGEPFLYAEVKLRLSV